MKIRRGEGVNRGEFGYIDAKKKKSLIGVLCMVVLGLAIFLLGLFLNKMSNRNVFTVIAVLFVLPGAKFLVALIVTMPYHSVTRQRYEKVKEKLAPGAVLYTDMVITSSEKIMHLDFAVVGNGQVLALLGKGKQELAYVKKYLSDGVRNWGSGYTVKIVDSEKTFLADVAAMKEKEVDQEEEEKVRSYLISLIV